MARGMPKKETIRKMFAGISRRYDLLNNMLSLGRDRQWRRFATSKLPEGYILDVCSGTGDVAIEVSKKSTVISSDFCREMLDIGRKKIEILSIDNIFCIQNDAENLSFRDGVFDGTIVAFGIRNVSDMGKALFEMKRVVRKGGKIVILEFSRPSNMIFKSIYYLYFKKILPIVGTFVSKSDGAYSYLPASVMSFPKREEFTGLMKNAGLKDIEFYDLTFGIVTAYVGTK